jgi:hypothetical protein
MVCAIRPTRFSDISEDAVLVFTASASSQVNVKVAESAQVRIWSSVGVLVGEYTLNEGDNVLGVDNLEGVYLLEIIFENGNHTLERVVF